MICQGIVKLCCVLTSCCPIKTIIIRLQYNRKQYNLSVLSVFMFFIQFKPLILQHFISMCLEEGSERMK